MTFFPAIEARASQAWAALERRQARRSVITASLLVAVGQLAFAGIDRTWEAPGNLVAMRLLHAAAAAALASWAVARGGTGIAPARASAALVLLLLPFLPIFWIAEATVMGLGQPWAPFVGEKLVMMATALLVPFPLWVGGALVAAFAGEALLFWWWAGLDGHSAVIATGEPWVSMIFGAVAIVMLIHRARTRRVEQEYLRARAEAETFEALARIFLSVRDQANTPLQTLEVGVQLLERRHPDAGPIAARMERALSRLRQLGETLARYPPPAGWENPGEVEDLDRLLAGIGAPQPSGAPGEH